MMRFLGYGLCLVFFSLCFPVQATEKTKLLLPSKESRALRYTGDFDPDSKRRVIRALVPYSKTFFFFDKAEPKGLTYDRLRAFEDFINQDEKDEALRVRIAVIPTPRDRLFSGLLEGRGDIAAGNLTITRSREKEVVFSDALQRDVQEIVVTAKGEKPLESVEDLSAKLVKVRKSSSYYASLQKLNQMLEQKGKSPVKIELAHENLEDEDLMGLLDAGLEKAIIVDRHKAELWAKLYKNLMLHPKAVLRDDAQIGWALRKNNPVLENLINGFVTDARQGTLLGNVMINKYLKSTKQIRDAVSPNEMAKAHETSGLFQGSGEIHDLDWLLLLAQGYQESGLDQSAVSPAGAIGIMQLLPTTAADPNVGIPDISTVENNIAAGSKYMRFIMDRYMSDETIDPFNRHLLALASYNAGPARINRLRKQAAERGLDPNKWFLNVEYLAAEDIGRENVDYVLNIYLYYMAYKRAIQHQP